ncbi:MAG: carotenoid biosynthesis protein [Flavobacteriales bacterium]
MTNSEEPIDQSASYYLRYKRSIDRAIGLIFLIGAWGTAIPRSQVLDQIPIVLWLVVIFLFLTHNQKTQLFVFKFLLLILAGWSIEVMGVQGGILFGKYGYGNLFGKSILAVPVVCGAIWLSNTLMMMQVSRYVLRIQGYWKTVLVAALCMTALDAFAQLPAFKIGFWSYKDMNYPPFFHSIGYFGISMLTCAAAGDDFVTHKNSGAISMALIQTVFLVFLYTLALIFR